MPQEMYIGYKYYNSFPDKSGIKRLIDNGSFCYLEKIDEVRIVKFTEDIDLSEYSAGRIFSPHHEIKWKYYDDLFHFVAFTDNSELISDWMDVKKLEGQKKGEMILWSREEDRIPHDLKYPDGIKRGVIKYSKFISLDGSGEFIKYDRLEEYKEDG